MFHINCDNMKKHSICLAAVALALSTSTTVMAVPAKKGLMNVITADGTELKVRLAGDEYFHQYFTEDGYPLIERQGEFFYCDITESGDIRDSGIKAVESKSRSGEAVAFLNGIDLKGLESRIVARSARAVLDRPESSTASAALRRVAAVSGQPEGVPYPQGYGLFPESRGPRFPAYGDQRALVILVEYQDVPFNLEDPHDYFSRMLNENGFSDYGATGCAAEYFRENSSGAFTPTFDVYGPVKLSRNRAYYGSNDSWGNDSNPEQMVIEALEQLDAEVDFSQYDRDGDGFIDNVFLFYAGRGEASGGGDETVWPHANNLSRLNESGHVFDGVEADHYGCTNEWTGMRPDGVGTFIHEFGHILGLPDLYATTYTNAFTPGAWCVMDYGSYNNDGMTPPYYGAFERYALGWTAPRPIDRAVSALLPPVEDNVVGIINTESDTEFFLVENRQQNGWDKYIPGHGMLVWHIDYNELVWSSNSVNNVGAHQYVDLEEADGKRTDTTRAGDAFPGTDGVTSFTAETQPSMTTWNKVPVNYPITDIEETADGMIKFKVLGGNDTQVPAVGGTDATDVTADGFLLTWEVAEGYDHLVSVYTRGDSGEISYVQGYRARNCGGNSQLRVEGLEPETEYLYTVMASDGWSAGEPSEEKSVTTGRLDLSYFAVTATEATDISDSGFTANWMPLEDATSYLVSVSKRIGVGPYSETCDFSDGVTNLPEGWESTSTKSYGMATYCGASAPSLRLGQNDDSLTTPIHADGIKSVSFWMRGNATDGESRICVDVLTDDGWKECHSEPIATDEGGKTVECVVDGDPSRARVRFQTPSGNGSVAVDDVKVEYGMQYGYEPLPGLTKADAGDELSYEVTGLLPATEYVYTVAATDGMFTSKESDPVLVTTKANLSVDRIEANVGLRISCRTVTADSGIEIVVYDVAGRVVAKGHGTVVLPDAGTYIVRLPEIGLSAKYIAR